MFGKIFVEWSYFGESGAGESLPNMPLHNTIFTDLFIFNVFYAKVEYSSLFSNIVSKGCSFFSVPLFLQGKKYNLTGFSNMDCNGSIL